MQCQHCESSHFKKAGRFLNQNRSVQRYKCRDCQRTFSEIQPLHETRIDEEKAQLIIRLLCEGTGVRASARLSGVSNGTILSVLRSAGTHCRKLLNAKLRNLTPSHIEIDECWTFVHTKLISDHPVFGDQFCWLAMDAQSKLICSWHLAKRTSRASRYLLNDLRSRVAHPNFNITTDGFHAYRGRFGAVFGAFGRNGSYGLEIKSYSKSNPLSFARSPQVCTSCKRVLCWGERDTKSITVNHVERQNLNIRLFNRRFTRSTICFSKKFANLEHSLALMVAYHNFCRVHGTIKKTPANAAGLTDHTWTVKELLTPISETIC